MFESDNKKRPSPDPSEQGVRLKKSYRISYGDNLDTQNLNIRTHNQFIGPCGVNLLSPADCFTPRSPRITSKGYAPDVVEPLDDDTSLLALLENDISDESTHQPHPWFENGEETPYEDLVLEDGNVIPRACFGVVSCTDLYRFVQMR
jgi:hypothetical protein